MEAESPTKSLDGDDQDRESSPELNLNKSLVEEDETFVLERSSGIEAGNNKEEAEDEVMEEYSGREIEFHEASENHMDTGLDLNLGYSLPQLPLSPRQKLPTHTQRKPSPSPSSPRRKSASPLNSAGSASPIRSRERSISPQKGLHSTAAESPPPGRSHPHSPPLKQRSSVGLGRRPRSPGKKRSPSVIVRRSLSPQKKRGPSVESPTKRSSVTPVKWRGPSAETTRKRDRSRSPRRDRSPKKDNSLSPVHHRERSRSRTPPSHNHQRSPSRSPRSSRRSPRRERSPGGRYSRRRRSSPSRSRGRRHSPGNRRPWSPPVNRSNGVGKPGNNLFIAGFNFITTERDLERKFSRYGRVMDVRIVRDKRSGESRGFGFLTLERDEDADAAIKALDQTEWNGRIVLVEKAKTPTRF